jgi:hypothetical protein
VTASAKPSPFFGIELFQMGAAHTRRVGALLGDLDRGKLPVEEAIQVLLDLVNEFIGSFEDDPEVARVLHSLSGRRLGIQVEGLTGVTGTLAAGEKVKVDRGVINGVPALVFKDVPTFEALLTGKLDDVEALRSGRIQVKHLPDFLKMVAPVVALQSKRKKEFQERIQGALDRVLRERGY